jgi:hypothetical protein
LRKTDKTDRSRQVYFLKSSEYERANGKVCEDMGERKEIGLSSASATDKRVYRHRREGK